VGAKPAPAVRALARLAGVTVTGRVEDVRPYLAHAHAAVASLRIARGIQNKVLEALAMGKVLLATPQAYEGIEDFEGRRGCISDLPEVMAAAALNALEKPEPLHVAQARAMAVSRYNWRFLLDVYQGVLEGAELRARTTPMATAAAGLEICP
jgi:glycosyltransferase involved in cell wall biosynthesis